MRLEKLILKDFLTFDSLEYTFQPKATLIQGENKTDDGQKSNGSGKSGLQTGIEFCITASNSRGVPDGELITYGKESANAQLFVNCDVRKEELWINWTLNLKKSNKLSLKKRKIGTTEWVDVGFSNVNDGKKYIIDWFAISKEDLFNYYIINKTRFKSFFKSSNKEKVELINRFSDASIVDGIENVNADKIEKLRIKEGDLSDLVNQTKGKIDLINEQIERESNKDFDAILKEAKDDINLEIMDLRADIDDECELILSYKNDIKVLEGELSIDKKRLVIIDKNKIALAAIKTCNNKISETKEKLVEANKQVDAFIKTDFTKKKSLLKEQGKAKVQDSNLIKEEIKKSESQVTKALSILEQINVKLSGKISCPSCAHEFIVDSKETVEELGAKAKQVKKIRTQLNSLIEQKNKELDEVKGLISVLEEKTRGILRLEEAEEQDFLDLKKNVVRVQEQINLVEGNATKFQDLINTGEKKLLKIQEEVGETKMAIREVELEIESTEKEVVRINAKITELEEKRDSLTLENNKDSLKTLKANLKKYKKEEVEIEEKLSAVVDEIHHTNEWSLNFKQFKMFLANRSLKIIQGHCNRYLQDMDSDMRVVFEGYKILASGKVKDEITAKIVRENSRSANSFSTGEQGRLLFASILANRYMINSTHKYGGLDFISIDEIFEGVDSSGLKNIIKSAESLDICVMFITHMLENDIADNIIKIVKRNKISKIEN